MAHSAVCNLIKLINSVSRYGSNTVQTLKRIKAITGQKQGNHTIRTVFFITVSK